MTVAAKLRITYVKSATKYHHSQRTTLGHLGLRRLHQSVIQPDNPQIRGMIRKVEHLVRTEKAE